MASGTTYQALKRLSWLPERTENENGSVIGGQRYDDVFFTGGTIENVTLLNVNIPNVSIISSEKVYTTGNTGVTALLGSLNIWNSATAANKIQPIPASTGSRTLIFISDAFGNANLFPITAVPITGSIIGLNQVYTENGSLMLLDSSIGWLSL